MAFEQKYEYRYQKEIDEIIKATGNDYPPRYNIDKNNVYRFVHKDINHPNKENDIKGVYDIKPSRYLTKDDKIKGKSNPTGWSLSMYEDLEKATHKLIDLTIDKPDLLDNLGDSIAEVSLTNEDGDSTEANQESHFEFFDFKKCNIKDIIYNGIIRKTLTEEDYNDGED